MCDPHPASYALAFENERLLAAAKYADDPVVSAAGWECIYDGGNATCLAFDARGLFFSIADATGRVAVWSVSTGRQLVRTLQVPLAQASVAAPGEAVIVCLAWSCNSRALFAGTAAGTLVVWDVSLGVVERVLKAPAPLRAIRSHPTRPSVLLLLPETGMPWLCDWGTGALWEVPEELLESPASPQAAMHLTETRQSGDGEAPLSGSLTVDAPPPSAVAVSAPQSAAPLRVDACFHPARAADLYIISGSQGILLRIHCSWEDGDGSGGGAFGGSFSRVRSADVAGALSPPELTHSRHRAILLVPSRAGVQVYDSNTLQLLDEGTPYSEPVEHTPLISARLLRRDSYVVALPHAKSSHMSGGVYAFRRGAALSSRLIAGPPGGLVLVEPHPWLGVLAGLVSTGEVYLLQQPVAATPAVFPGPMYPPGFKLQMRNSEYLEAEDELDLLDERGRVLFELPRGSVVLKLSRQRASLETVAGGDPEGADVDACSAWRDAAACPDFGSLEGVAALTAGDSVPAPTLSRLPIRLYCDAIEGRGKADGVGEPRGSEGKVRRALSLVLGVSLPQPRPPASAESDGDTRAVDKPAAPPSMSAVPPALDPFAPLLLAAEPGLLLNPLRLQEVTRSIDTPAFDGLAGKGTGVLLPPDASPPLPHALLLDTTAPLLAMPTLIPAAPVQEELSRQYLSVLGDLAGELHAVVARAFRPLPASASDDSSAVVVAARAAVAAAAEAAQMSRAALAAPFDPPAAPDSAVSTESLVVSAPVSHARSRGQPRPMRGSRGGLVRGGARRPSGTAGRPSKEAKSALDVRSFLAARGLSGGPGQPAQGLQQHPRAIPNAAAAGAPGGGTRATGTVTIRSRPRPKQIKVGGRLIPVAASVGALIPVAASVGAGHTGKRAREPSPQASPAAAASGAATVATAAAASAPSASVGSESAGPPL